MVTFSFPKDSNPLTHLGNFKPHEQNLEDVLVSVVCHASKTQPQHWIEQCAVSSFQHTVFVGQSLFRLLLRLVVLYITPDLVQCFVSFIRANQPFSRETQLPKNPVYQQKTADALSTLCACVHMCVFLCLLMHHFPHFGHCLLFPPPGKSCSLLWKCLRMWGSAEVQFRVSTVSKSRECSIQYLLVAVTATGEKHSLSH